MAHIDLPDQNRRISEHAEMRDFLKDYGIEYERWPTGADVSNSSPEAILEAYACEIQRLKEKGGYITADVIDVTPDVPGLQAMLDRFNKEHRHAEDEVRFIVKGNGVFHIHPPEGPVFAIQVTEGDLINVPAGTAHWFDLCADRTIRAIRLFREKAGWTPEYTNSGIAGNYHPLCLGPEYLSGRGKPRLQPLPI